MQLDNSLNTSRCQLLCPMENNGRVHLLKGDIILCRVYPETCSAGC